MKKTKLFIPLLGLAVSTYAAASMLVLSNCSKKATTNEVLNLWKDPNGNIVLGGFKPGVSDETIKKVFGDTLTIPKNVNYIVPYAFLDKKTMKSTIPSFIKHFKFEEGYECKEIPEYAFYGAPFESIEIECERIDGFNEDGRGQWRRPEGGWGLQSIGDHAFFQTYDLTYVKLCASITNCANVVFGYEDYEQNVLSYINTIDISDWRINDGDNSDQLLSTFKTMFSTDFSTPVPVKPEQEPIRGKIILRSYNGTDSFRKINDSSQYRDQFNIYRGVFGVPAETAEVNLRFGDYWDITPRYNKMNHFGDYEFERETTKVISHQYKVSFYHKFFPGFLPAKMEIDLSKWEGQLPSKWQIIFNVDSYAEVFTRDSEIEVYLNDVKLGGDKITINSRTNGLHTVDEIELKKTDKIYVSFFLGVDLENINLLFSETIYE